MNDDLSPAIGNTTGDAQAIVDATLVSDVEQQVAAPVFRGVPAA